jgi:PAS domain S-box-containing protein
MARSRARPARELRAETQSQAALSEAVLATAHDAFVSIDAGGEIIAWNARAETLFGWPAAIAVGRSLARTIIPPARRAAHAAGLERFLSTGDARIFNKRLEMTARHRDGTEFPVDMTITPLRLGGTYSFNAFMADATERRRAARHRDAQHGVVLSLAQAATVECALAGALEALGTSLGWEFASFWSADCHRQALQCAGVWHTGARGLDGFAAATRALTLDPGEGLPGRTWAQGSPTWLENVQRERWLSRRSVAARARLQSAVCVPVRCDGELVGALELFGTQTRRREPDLVGMLEATASQLGQFVERKRAEAESDRLKGEFFALVSHELATPLTAIMGYVELLREEPGLGPDPLHFVEVIDRNAGRLAQLIGDVLFVTQVEAGRIDLQLEPVALDELVSCAVQAAQARAAELQIALTATVQRVPAQMGDRERLDQLLDNLISNALKFTPPGGAVEVALTGDADGVVLCVRDSGIGIPDDEQEHLFERFYRASAATTRAISGAGLGLTIAKAIVEGHGGQIAVRSRAGAGTSMCARLPARPVAAPRSPAAARRAAAWRAPA